MEKRLTVGRIAYANLYQIFAMLEKIGGEAYRFVEGVPSYLNRLVRNGEIEISPSSSIEYLRHQETYHLIEGHSISSFGPIGSIFLFSRRPIETLDGLTVLTTSQSETSVALLAIVLRKFHGLSCPLRSTDKPLSEALESFTACLLIGDSALREAARWPKLFVYDLGDIWFRNTGLPFVFALWIANRERCRGREEMLETFRRDLDRAKTSALRTLSQIAATSPYISLATEAELVAYWQGISYDLGEEHRKGLELFKAYARELGLL